jgi:hypothetical protein
VARSILFGIYHLFKRAIPWRALGANYFDQRNPLQVVQRITKRLQSLGYHVDLTPLPTAA